MDLGLTAVCSPALHVTLIGTPTSTTALGDALRRRRRARTRTLRFESSPLPCACVLASLLFSSLRSAHAPLSLHLWFIPETVGRVQTPVRWTLEMEIWRWCNAHWRTGAAEYTQTRRVQTSGGCHRWQAVYWRRNRHRKRYLDLGGNAVRGNDSWSETKDAFHHCESVERAEERWSLCIAIRETYMTSGKQGEMISCVKCRSFTCVKMRVNWF